MQNLKSNLFTLGVLAIFAASCSVNHIHANNFNTGNKVDTSTQNCLVRNDGTQIPGDDIYWDPGVFAGKIRIDKQKFSRSEIKGYFKNGSYYGMFKNRYGRRIIHGKINVYVDFAMVSGVTSSGGYLDAYFYAQLGDDGPMTMLSSTGRIRKILEACPLSVELLNKGRGKMNKDPNFLNHLFDVYNEGCEE